MLLDNLLERSYNHKLAAGQRYTLHGAPSQGVEITQLTEDSRKAEGGSLFFALRGATSDGHRFVPKAIEQGARAIVLETLPEELHPETTYILVDDSHEAMGLIAAGWWGHPSDALTVVGVTGTNGKTTIATLLYRLWRGAGYPSGLLSTVCNYIDGRPSPSTHTTPGAIQLQALLAEMLQAGCSHVFMEVSSHAVDQRRIAGIAFAGGIFTNLTRDHLDYHGTFKEYLQAKKRFFDDLPREAWALSNLDDRNGQVMMQNTSARGAYYALRNLADYRAIVLERYPEGTQLEIDGHEVMVRLLGEFNIYNLLAVYGASLLMGMPREEVLRHLSMLTSVDGRLETLHSAKGFTAFVDYAHTPDALVNVLETLRQLEPQRIICVVGCGGDRDRGKRPIMATEAARLSDRLILTSDNPRSERPEDIIAEMKSGLDAEALARTISITDRAEAIRTATLMAQRGDYILVAGKGHETYQEIQGVRHPFDDREIVKALL